MRGSLAARLLVPISLALVLATGTTGYAVHHLMRQSIEVTIEARLRARLAWLSGRIENDDGELEFTDVEVGEAPDHAEAWRVLRHDPADRILWSSRTPMPDGPTARTVATTITIEADLDDHHEDEREDGGDREGDHGRSAPPRGVSATPVRGIDVRLVAGTDVAGEYAALRMADLLLATTLPVFLVAMLAMIWFIVRKETGPLTGMAAYATSIDPGKLSPQDISVPAGAGSREVADLARALENMLIRLADGLKRERSFSAAAAHELRTPLAQLVTGLEIALRQERDPDQYRQTIRDALADGRRLTNLVASILDLTRSSSAGAIGQMTVAELCDLCRTWEVDPQRVGDIAPDLAFAGDASTVTMIVGNLIANAHHHGKCEPVITLAREDGTVVIAVADTGPGIPPADREQVFRPLVRLDSARTITDGEGFGLGLAIVAAVVGRLGGIVTCDDRADGRNGIVFSVRLPIVGHRRSDTA